MYTVCTGSSVVGYSDQYEVKRKYGFLAVREVKTRCRVLMFDHDGPRYHVRQCLCVACGTVLIQMVSSSHQ